MKFARAYGKYANGETYGLEYFTALKLHSLGVCNPSTGTMNDRVHGSRVVAGVGEGQTIKP